MIRKKLNNIVVLFNTANMYPLRQALFTAAKKTTLNGYKLQRTVSGLDPRHIASGSYLYKNFIKKQHPPKTSAPLWKKWIKNISKKEINNGYELYHTGAQILCLKKKIEK